MTAKQTNLFDEIIVDNFAGGGGPDTVRLIQGTSWVEITQDTLEDCFEEVD